MRAGENILAGEVVSLDYDKDMVLKAQVSNKLPSIPKNMPEAASIHKTTAIRTRPAISAEIRWDINNSVRVYDHTRQEYIELEVVELQALLSYAKKEIRNRENARKKAERNAKKEDIKRKRKQMQLLDNAAKSVKQELKELAKK